MKTIKGPAIFLAQFSGDVAPFDSLEAIANWASRVGYIGIQIPSWDKRLFNLNLAAESKDYCDEIVGKLKTAGMVITELSSHLQGQLVASHPAYARLLDSFAPPELAGDAVAQQKWACEQLRLAARASNNLGLTAHVTFSGALAWPFFYPWPQRQQGLIEEAFKELAQRWHPILDAFETVGVDLCYELHPGEDLFDGTTFERFLSAVKDHPRAKILYDPSHLLLQQMDYIGFLDRYHERISAFHVKDAEYRATASSGVYGGYLSWVERPGRFRSLGDGQIDFKTIFSKLTQYDYSGWAVLEWECCMKDSSAGAAEGARIIRDLIIPTTASAFDDFAGSQSSQEMHREVLGL